MTDAPRSRKVPRRRLRAFRLKAVKRSTAAAGDSAGLQPSANRALPPIVSPHSVARRTLLALVAIMSFLACLAVAAVTIVADRAEVWRRQIADEVTIQIKPADGVDLEPLVARAAEVAMQVPGVLGAAPISESDASALLEPWLGSDFDRSELPIPRLVAVRISEDVDLAALQRRLAEEVPGSSLDDHGRWMQRLSEMAGAMSLMGLLVLALVFAATALCAVFATRGAMAGNRDVIEVLHFVGAEDTYVARQFQTHFLLLGLKGAGIGGGAAIVAFALVGLLSGLQGTGTEQSPFGGMLGGFVVGPSAYLGSLVTVILLGVIIAGTAGLTVRRTLTELD